MWSQLERKEGVWRPQWPGGGWAQAGEAEGGSREEWVSLSWRDCEGEAKLCSEHIQATQESSDYGTDRETEAQKSRKRYYSLNPEILLSDLPHPPCRVVLLILGEGRGPRLGDHQSPVETASVALPACRNPRRAEPAVRGDWGADVTVSRWTAAKW